MNKLYKENGLLSEHGVVVTHPVKMACYKLLNINNEIKQLSEDELRTLGGALQKIVGDAISERIAFKREVATKLAEMNDAQFEALLKAKYGSNWMFQTLSNEELTRCPRTQQQEIENILKESAKHVTKFPRNGIRK